MRLQSYLKGHSGLVTAMGWSADDSVLVSCADDGSLYEWDISDGGKRLHELVIKSCSYSDVVLTSKCVRSARKHFSLKPERTNTSQAPSLKGSKLPPPLL